MIRYDINETKRNCEAGEVLVFVVGLPPQLFSLNDKVGSRLVGR